MRAAIYVRRSTEEHQAESLETQLDGARRFIASKGWTVVAEFRDSGSRAEFKKRQGLIQLLAAAASKSFEWVVMRDETRLGGDMLRTGLIIQDLAEAGVGIVHYSTGEVVRADDSTSRLVVAVKNFSAELEREKVSSRTRERLERNARGGLVAGGSVYGYENVPVQGGKTWRILEDEADVVREIFRRYAAGEGLRTIAKDLNSRRVPAPRAGKRGTGSWSYSSIREMLRRERYRGTLVWGRHAKAYRGGTKVRLPRPESDWITIEVPELRIVPEELWEAVRRREEPRKRLTGSRARGRAPRYLLSGIGRCAECGGPIRADNAKVSHDNVRVYACSWHRDRGPAVCGNGLRRPVRGVDVAVLEQLRAVLAEDVLEEAIRLFRRRSAKQAAEAKRDLPRMQAETTKLRDEVARLAEMALEAPKGAAKVFYAQLADRQRLLEEREARMVAAKATASAQAHELRELEQELRERFAEFDAAIMAASPVEARRALETLLDGPLRFLPVETDEGKRYRVEGELALEPMRATECSTVRVPSGCRTVLQIPWAAVA